MKGKCNDEVGDECCGIIGARASGFEGKLLPICRHCPLRAYDEEGRLLVVRGR